jgi:hypothetical protein
MSAAVDPDPTGPDSPADPRVAAAVLAMVWKYGLYPVAIVSLLGLFAWRLLGVVDARAVTVDQRLEHLQVTLAAHQAAMEQAGADRRANDRAVLTLLRGICLASTDTGSQARAFCDAD